jgi:hypothetical protein
MNGPPAFQLGRLLVIAGVILVALGLLFMAGSKFSFFRLGSLPGDIAYKGKNFQFYFPIVTCLVLSGLITLVLWIISLLTKK